MLSFSHGYRGNWGGGGETEAESVAAYKASGFILAFGKQKSAGSEKTDRLFFFYSRCKCGPRHRCCKHYEDNCVSYCIKVSGKRNIPCQRSISKRFMGGRRVIFGSTILSVCVCRHVATKGFTEGTCV